LGTLQKLMDDIFCQCQIYFGGLSLILNIGGQNENRWILKGIKCIVHKIILLFKGKKKKKRNTCHEFQLLHI
jgi:hypothetical protein